MDCLPAPETPVTSVTLSENSSLAPKRFRSITDTELQEFQGARQSKSTKRNTKWGIQLFQGIQS
jgi:hypothetical protein